MAAQANPLSKIAKKLEALQLKAGKLNAEILELAKFVKAEEKKTPTPAKKVVAKAPVAKTAPAKKDGAKAPAKKVEVQKTVAKKVEVKKPVEAPKK